MRHKLLYMVVTTALAVSIGAGFVRLRHEGDALAAHAYQEQQLLLAQLAAERLADRLAEVRLHLLALTAPEQPGQAPGGWLLSPDLAAMGATAFVHDGGGRVLVVPPGLPPEVRDALVAHRHDSSTGGLCGACLTDGGRLGVSQALPGQPDTFIAAAVDPSRLHATLFAPLSGPHDAYAWVMRADRTIISAPDPSATGTRPFATLPPPVRDGLEPVLAAMAAGDTGTAAYAWRVDGGLRERLVAYTPVPGWSDLSVAYSADRTSVTARTDALHRAGAWTLALLMVTFAVLVGSVAFVARNKMRVERQARLALSEAQEGLLRLERLSTIGQLTASIAHEIKNPLSFVTLNAHLMRSIVAKLPSSHGAGGAHTECVDMLDDMLVGVTRIDAVVAALGRAGRSGDAPAPLDLRRPIETALLLARPHLIRRATVDVELEGPLRARAVPGELVQVFLNLLVNAAQACTAGDRRGRLTVRGAVDGDTVRVDVTDDGPGIPVGVRDRVFEAFFTTKPETEGSGLGLPISREIAERHGGSLSFVTGPGGTTFTLRLPRLDHDAAPADLPAESAA